MRFFNKSDAEFGIITDWTQTVLAIDSTGTAPTKAASPNFDRAFWRRVGENMEIQFEYSHSAGGTAGTGDYFLVLPNSHTVNTSNFPNAGAAVTGNYCGSGTISSTGHPNYMAIWLTDTVTTNGIYCRGTNSSADETRWKSNVWDMAETTLVYAGFVSVPITGWSNT
jgi:hypothetical protein